MNLIPKPKEILMKDGSFSLKDTAIYLKNCDERNVKQAIKLKNEIENVSNTIIKLTYGADEGDIFITSNDNNDEGYYLEITDINVKIIGNSQAGVFYGIQTLLQIIKLYGCNLPCCKITDKPDFPQRGFYHDISRGRVSTLSGLKKLVDTLSHYKINTLQLYIENAFDFIEYNGITKKDNLLTHDEILELDQYCHNHFIELVPSLSTFGHLYNLLQSEKYCHLCEYENYIPQRHYWIEKMKHHTIDVSNEQSIELIKSLIDQYIILFRSDKFNICCDETIDLCKGRNSGKDAKEEYFNFLIKIINHVKSRGKKVMMWGDIILQHPELISKLPNDIIMLNWDYSKLPDESKAEAFAKGGLQQIMCPGTSTWNRFTECIRVSESNITKMVQYGYKYKAVGVLNTNWGDYGNVCCLNASLYSTIIGAEKSWNAETQIDEKFDVAVNYLVYNDTTNKVVSLIKELSECELFVSWQNLVIWYSANVCEKNPSALETDIELAIKNCSRSKEIANELSALKVNNEDLYNDLVVAANAVHLMNRLYLTINKVESFEDVAGLKYDFECWFDEYSNAWKRDNKQSELDLIIEFINDVFGILA